MQEDRKMKLYVDIGNTNTALAFVDNREIIKKFSLRTSREIIDTGSIRRMLAHFSKTTENIYIVSVVPGFLDMITRSLSGVFPHAVISLIGKDLTVPIKVNYDRPEQIGQDRLVAAYSGKLIMGSPVLVIDFGSAVTFDLVNPSGEYEGGLIFPGIRMGLTAMGRDTALLPFIDLERVKGTPVGKNTEDSINKGVVIGYAELCDGIIRRYSSLYDEELKVIATGGDAGLISGQSACISTVSPELIFKGLIELTG
jgi:type III pantothenate kinase